MKTTYGLIFGVSIVIIMMFLVAGIAGWLSRSPHSRNRRCIPTARTFRPPIQILTLKRLSLKLALPPPPFLPTIRTCYHNMVGVFYGEHRHRELIWFGNVVARGEPNKNLPHPS